MRFIALLGFILIHCAAWSLSADEKLAIIERIQPIGQVRVSPSNREASNDSAAQARASMVYEKYCIICHQEGLAGAPRFQNETDWQPRLKEKKLEDLVSSAIKGLNAMPPKGTCSDCSEQDISNAIQFMLPHHE